ncbi:MAG: cytochrome c oxidase accessory protein CcoG [Kordiimonadaceae bacterium]|nr:cytochrome c oxidase accessory protein CcoG [Kordiimonadaceae bacterium]
MTDLSASNKLFVKSPRIFPKRTWGRFRQLKWAAMLLLLGIYYLTPFIRYDRGEFAPDQAILIDMVHQRAYFFFIELWPQEVFYLAGILILAALGLFFVTSLFGRAWCGYACPQTVWTDLFVWVERIVQGDRQKRLKLHNASWSLEKIWKMAVTHSLWLVIGLFTGGAWVFYFNDAPTLLEQILLFDVPWPVLGWIISLTFSTYLMAGFARDQVCKYMCPYARFQSAMFDKNTLIIGYDEMRGEKRGKKKKTESWEGRGHCVDCTACVQVCPMGIDIRDGLQMECIACGLCIDACDTVMNKLDLPKNLIRYDTLSQQDSRLSGKFEKTKLIRPRTIYYALFLLAISGLMMYGLISRSDSGLHILRDRNPLFVQLSNGTIRNGYDVKILNKGHEDRHYKLTVGGIEGLTVRVQGVGNITAGALPVFADSIGHFRVFITAPKPVQKRTDIMFHLEPLGLGDRAVYDSVFVSEK